MDLFGMRIMESPLVQPVPVLQSSALFRKKLSHVPSVLKAFDGFDAWLLQRFGTKEVMYVIGGNVLMNPKQVLMLRNFSAA